MKKLRKILAWVYEKMYEDGIFMIEFREKFYARRDKNVEWKEEITSVDILKV